jgi:hypothetical protein
MQKKQKQNKPLKRKMNRTTILAFYKARERRGDNQRIADETGYSVSHISNVKACRRSINDDIANTMYYLSHRRVINQHA